MRPKEKPIELYLAFTQEQNHYFFDFAENNLERAIEKMKGRVDDALPNNSVVLFKVTIDKNEWVATAHWTPEDVEITMKKT
jgi:hypothetical protein